MPITTAQAVAEYLGNGRTAAEVTEVWKSAETYVSDRCVWPEVDADGNPLPAPDTLVRAVLLQAARYQARRNSPDGFIGMGEFGPARVPVTDHDVNRAMAPYRKAVLA